jgi:hypothetical protein
MGRVVHALVVCIAFAATLLVPFAARAAFVPACESHEWSGERAAVPALAAPGSSEATDACSAVRDGDEDALDPVAARIAAMCDARGASIVAPQRVLPIADARIDAEPGCGFDLSTPHVGPSPDDAPAATAAHALAQHATLDVLALVPPAESALLPAYPPVAGDARPGHARGVDHPPRG